MHTMPLTALFTANAAAPYAWSLVLAGAVVVAAALGEEPGGAEGPQSADGAPPAS